MISFLIFLFVYFFYLCFLPAVLLPPWSGFGRLLTPRKREEGRRRKRKLEIVAGIPFLYKYEREGGVWGKGEVEGGGKIQGLGQGTSPGAPPTRGLRPPGLGGERRLQSFGSDTSGWASPKCPPPWTPLRVKEGGGDMKSGTSMKMDPYEGGGREGTAHTAAGHVTEAKDHSLTTARPLTTRWHRLVFSPALAL